MILRFLKEIFQSKQRWQKEMTAPVQVPVLTEEQIKRQQLKKVLENIVSYYNLKSCSCAFPRFHQYVSIDCVDYGASFFCVETEDFIDLVEPYFEKEDIPASKECTEQIWTCKTCGSRFQFAWSDFSIYISRCYLKNIDLKVTSIGAQALTPMPYYLGFIGHSYPKREGFKEMELLQFENYLKELTKH